MEQAMALARRGLYSCHPNPRVGCLIVKNGEVAGQGWHEQTGKAHAEVMALTEAGGQARGATAYVTLEPCSHHGRTEPCCDALIEAGVARVVAAMADPYTEVAGRGLARLKAAGVELQTGDNVVLIKDLDVKGSSLVAKRGTAVRGISLVLDNPEHIEGKVEGQRIVILTKFTKKS